MILVWKGRGGYVPLFNFIAFFLYACSLMPFDGKHLNLATDIAVHLASGAVCGALAAFAIYRVSRIGKGKQRNLIDEATGQRVVIKKSAGSFFGIPTANWVMITAGLWVFIAIAGVMGGELR